MPLTDTAIRKIKAAVRLIKLLDGGGFQPNGHPNGSE
jgi:hypothetical protein